MFLGAAKFEGEIGQIHAWRFNGCEDACMLGSMHQMIHAWTILKMVCWLLKFSKWPFGQKRWFSILQSCHLFLHIAGYIVAIRFMMFTPYGHSKPSIHTSKWLFKLLINDGNFSARVASLLTLLNSIGRM